MPEHNVITDPNIHEPKGASTASANEIYIADGAGSGTWTDIGEFLDLGWENIADNGSAQVFNTTAAKLSIDGAGSSSNSTYLPPSISGSSNLWSTSNNEITPIAVGDTYNVRLDLPITAKTGSPNFLLLELDIGGGVSPSIVIVSRSIDLSKTPPFDLSVGFSIFTLSTFLANGGQFFLSTDTGTASVTNPGLFITRVTRNF